MAITGTDSRPVCAYADVIKYAAKNTEHAHQVALFMWIAHAAWEHNEKNKAPARAQTYFLHSKTDKYIAFTKDQIEDISEGLFAVPNGGARDQITASRLKAEGVKSGVADLMLPVAVWKKDDTLVGHGLFIEMKRPKSAEKGRRGVASEAQAAWNAIVTKNGYRWVLAERWNDALTALWDYLNG